MFNELKKLENNYNKLLNATETTKPLSKMEKFLKDELTVRYNKDEFFDYFLENHKKLKSLDLPRFFKSLNVNKIDDSFISGRDYTGNGFDPFYEKLSDEGLLDGLYKDTLINKNMKLRTSCDFPEIIKQLSSKSKLQELIEKESVSFDIKGSYNFSTTINIYKSLFEIEDWEALMDYSEHYETYIKHPDVGMKILKKEVEKIVEKYYNKHIFVYKAENGSLYELSIKG